MAFEDMFRQLRVAGAKLSDVDMVVSLFGTLPDSYNPLITTIENLGDVESIAEPRGTASPFGGDEATGSLS